MASYGTYAGVARYAPRIFKAPSGAPTSADVNEWLEEGYAIINAKLSAGYSVPVSSTADAYPLVRRLNEMYAAGIVEMTRTVMTTGPNDNQRQISFESRFDKGLDALMRLDLSAMGVGYTSTMYIGGISESDKESAEDDTDRIMTSFRRGQFANPGAGTTTAEVPGDSEERSD